LPQFILTFMLEAADHAAVEKLAGEWMVTPGAILHSIDGPPTATEGLPQTVPPTGDVGDAIGKAGGAGFAVSSLDPGTVTQGIGDVQVHVRGQEFVPGARIVFDGIELATAFVSPAELYCTVDAKLGGHAPGTFGVLVRQEGQDSATLPFTIAAA
jgi:hypothetical protein